MKKEHYNNEGRLTAQSFRNLFPQANITVTGMFVTLSTPIDHAVINSKKYSYEECVELFESNIYQKEIHGSSHTEEDTIAF